MTQISQRQKSSFEGAATRSQNRPVDVTALSLFFAFGAIMCAVAAFMIGSAGELHSFWKLVPAIATQGVESVSWLVFVFVGCTVAALGLWRCSYWGYLAASLLLMLVLASHFLRALVTNNWLRLLVVVTVGVLVLLYLRSRARLFVHRSS